MSSMSTTRKYNYKLRVSASKEEKLIREFGMCRWVWNECVDRFRRGEGSGKLDKCLTDARAKSPWLREGSVVAQQQMIRRYRKALSDSFEVPGRGRPRLKTKKKSRPSLTYTKRGFNLIEEKDHNGIKRTRLNIAKVGSIPVVWSRELPAEPSSAHIYQDAVGDWFVSFVVNVEGQDLEHYPDTGKTTGIDWGVKQPATTTIDELDLDYNPRKQKMQRNRAKYQRRMARLRKRKDQESKCLYKKNKKKAARLDRKAARQAQDDTYKWSNKVAREVDAVAVEDLKSAFIHKTKMAKKATENGVGRLKRTLIYVMEKRGKKAVLVNPAYTSQECCKCHARTKHDMSLKERQFYCTECGFTFPRDKNSAFVMEYRAGFNPTLDDGVRLENPRVSLAS